MIKTMIIPHNLSGRRLDQAIQQLLNTQHSPECMFSVKQVKKWLESGEINVSGVQRVRPSYRVNGGELIRFFDGLVSPNSITPPTGSELKSPISLSKKSNSKLYWDAVWRHARSMDTPTLSIPYIDEGLVIVNKPNGIPTSPTIDPQRKSLFHEVLAYLARLRPDQSIPYLRNVHRLDKDTSGLVIFSRSPKVTKGLAHIFKQRKVDKRYMMICHRCYSGDLYKYINQVSSVNQRSKNIEKYPINPWFEYTAYMDVEPQGQRQIQKWMVTQQGGQYAHTDFRLIEKTEKRLFLEARLKTGRTHQLRVHLSSLSAPIIGDKLYGKAEHCPLLLNASSLSFQHPLNGDHLHISAELPNHFMEHLM